MKKFFLLFALLSFTSFNEALAASTPPDACQDFGSGEGTRPVACWHCLSFLSDMYYNWSVNMGEPSCADAEKYYQWSEIVALYKKNYEYDRDNILQNCSSELDAFINVMELYAGEICKGRTPIEICTSDDTFCSCGIGMYNEIYDEQGFHCTACPENGESIGINEPITGCYLPAGSGETDTTGTWQYSQNCYYTK